MIDLRGWMSLPAGSYERIMEESWFHREKPIKACFKCLFKTVQLGDDLMYVYRNIPANTQFIMAISAKDPWVL